MHLIINLGELVHSLSRLIYFIPDTVSVMLCSIYYYLRPQSGTRIHLQCKYNFLRAFRLQLIPIFIPLEVIFIMKKTFFF